MRRILSAQASLHVRYENPTSTRCSRNQQRCPRGSLHNNHIRALFVEQPFGLACHVFLRYGRVRYERAHYPARGCGYRQRHEAARGHQRERWIDDGYV